MPLTPDEVAEFFQKKPQQILDYPEDHEKIPEGLPDAETTLGETVGPPNPYAGTYVEPPEFSEEDRTDEMTDNGIVEPDAEDTGMLPDTP